METKFSADYQVYEPGMMATNESTAKHGLKISQFFVTMNDGSYTFELGIHFIIILAFSIMAFKLYVCLVNTFLGDFFLKKCV